MAAQFKPADHLLEIRGLKTQFMTDDGLVHAVDGVDLTVDRGETLGVVGESGSGKSVTAMSVLKLIASPPGRIAAGEILWEGRDLVPLPADEMRKLGEKTAQSASQIDTVTHVLGEKSLSVEKAIQRGRQSLQSSQDFLENVATVLSEAANSVTGAAHGVDNITSSVREQTAVSNEIAQNVEKIAQMTEANSLAVNETSEAIHHLEQLANDLNGAANRFKV